MAILTCVVTSVVNGCSREVASETQLQPQGEMAVAESDDQSAPLPPDPLKLRQHALLALESGDVDAADGLIRASVLAAPDDPQSIFLMALILSEQHRFPEAIKMLDELAEAVPSTRLPVLGQTADLMVLNGQWQEAEDRYHTLFDLAPDAMIVHRKLAQLLIRQGRRLEAATQLRLLCRRGDIEEAELRALLMLVHPFAHDATITEFEPVWPLGEARFEISQGNSEKSVTLLQQLTTPRAAETALLGRLYAQQQNYGALGKWVAGESQSSEQSADYWLAMGMNAAHEGDHQTAVEYLCEAVLRDQTDKDAYSLLSQSLEGLKLDAQAKEAADRAERIARTQVIGNEMADSPQRDLQKMSELTDLLNQLHRPTEALAWCGSAAVQKIYPVGVGGKGITGRDQPRTFAAVTGQRH